MREDSQAYTALMALENYQPANPTYSKEGLTQLYQVMQGAAEEEVNAANVLATARDAVVAAEWNFHNAMLGVKAQVVAQYGHDSDEVQSLGLKKKSEHRRPTRTMEG
jgi:gentisate 1,2-dioxygenase